jgi:hypothetical protein
MATRRSRRAPNFTELAGSTDPQAPLDHATFLQAAQPVLALLQDDLAARAKASPAVTAALVARHADDRAQQRTGDSFVEWSERFVEQVAAAWLLSCVFVRTLEDRGLLGHNRLGGQGAADSMNLFLALAPSLNERDYLLTTFQELQRFAVTRELFDASHNPVWLLTPSAEAARALVGLFQTPRADAPAFRFGQTDTAFLGWLYQDLNANVRERFALLQTPRFVEEFILDRTLEPAIEKFGLDDTTIIDPTCGSGHFLLGAFERLFDHRLRHEPGLSPRAAATKALQAVAGADLNPYAVAIARFRLTLAFLHKAGFASLGDAPRLPMQVVVGDSLLHNPHVRQPDLADVASSSQGWRGREFALEDETLAKDVLHRTYAAVVGNPPYITVKDPVLRERYRADYPRSAAGKYSVAAPFTERFFHLARAGGRVGMITANSFMKREFGKKLIEDYLPTVNLDLVVNTSGAYIPGHGTPTVLLFGSHEPPRGTTVGTVLASRGEPATPADPAQGLVWRSIADQWNQPGFENEFISVTRTERAGLAKHPWSLGGGGAAELKELLEERAEKRLGDIATAIGIAAVTGEDDAYLLPADAANRLRVGRTAPLVTGEFVRDWSLAPAGECVFPYADDFKVLSAKDAANSLKYLWAFKPYLRKRKRFGTPMVERGLTWYELQELYADKLRTPLTITFAEVATHNHFVLDRGGAVFKNTAPIIKLPDTATEDDHLALLAYLNSSTACFWMKQVCFPKGGSGIGRGIQDEEWESRFQFDSTKTSALPLPNGLDRYRALARAVERNAVERSFLSPSAVLERWLKDPNRGEPPLADSRQRRAELCERAVALQEQIDWLVYEDFGLLSDSESASLRSTSDEGNRLRAGSRAFEHVLLREAPETSWFSRNGYSLPKPASCSENDAKIDIIRKNKNISILERPEYKRRWQFGNPEAEAADAATILLASAAEAGFGEKTCTAAEIARRSAESLLLPKFDALLALSGTSIEDVFLSSAVPFLGPWRFTETGLERFAEWERTWDLQRREDAGETIESIPVPPKYGQGDYRATTYWQLRGPLDVPKERFISYPGCASDEDGEPVYGWAGWDHEQRARALATLYVARRDGESWGPDRLTPMLAGLLELLPWLKQWHGQARDDYGGDAPAAYYEAFLDEECRKHGLTRDDLRGWRPPERARGRPKAAATTEAAAAPAGEGVAPKKRGRKKKAEETTEARASDPALEGEPS